METKIVTFSMNGGLNTNDYVSEPKVGHFVSEHLSMGYEILSTCSAFDNGIMLLTIVLGRKTQ